MLLLSLHSAAATRLPSIHISEMARMSWGTVAIPPSGAQYIELSPLNQSTHGTGQMLFGTPSRGVYKLSSSDGASGRPAAITIDIADVSTGSAALTLDHFNGVYASMRIGAFPSPTLPMPASAPGGTLLYLGARATVNSAMAAGSLAPTFDIDVIVN